MRSPRTEPLGGARFVVALAALLAVWNNAANLAPGFDEWYVLVNLAVAAALLLWARRHGLGWAEVGLGPGDAAAGARWGAVAVAVIAVVLGALAAVPATRPLLDDARVAAMTSEQVAFHALVRIPLGTVLLEEVAFRGVLLAAWERLGSRRTAIAGSSVVFGLWHLVPTVMLLDANELAADPLARGLALAAAVAITGAAGALLCLLRLASGSLLAPILAHGAANSLAAAASWAVR